jgi:hypothetical protein
VLIAEHTDQAEELEDRSVRRIVWEWYPSATKSMKARPRPIAAALDSHSACARLPVSALRLMSLRSATRVWDRSSQLRASRAVWRAASSSGLSRSSRAASSPSDLLPGLDDNAGEVCRPYGRSVTGRPPPGSSYSPRSSRSCCADSERTGQSATCSGGSRCVRIERVGFCAGRLDERTRDRPLEAPHVEGRRASAVERPTDTCQRERGSFEHASGRSVSWCSVRLLMCVCCWPARLVALDI